MTTPTHLLASDLDGTIIPLEWNDLRRAEVEELALAMGARDDLAVAYVTGRHLSLANKWVGVVTAWGSPAVS